MSCCSLTTRPPLIWQEFTELYSGKQRIDALPLPLRTELVHHIHAPVLQTCPLARASRPLLARLPCGLSSRAT